MKYNRNGTTIYRETAQGFQPVRQCKSDREALAMVVALTLNPQKGASWPVLPPSPAKPVKSGILDAPTPPLTLPDAYQEAWEKTYQRVLEDTGDAGMAQQAALGVIRRLTMGMPVKGRRSAGGVVTGSDVRIRKSGDVYVVEGWSVMFGDPDILDTWQTYFAADTDFFEEFYSNAPLWYEHGFDEAYGHKPIGRRCSLRRFKHGMYAGHELFADHPLIDRTLDELEKGELAYSSDSIGHYVDIGFNGAKLGVWPLAGISLVKRPAEPGLGLVTMGQGAA